MSKNDTSRQESLPAYLDDVQKRLRRNERKPIAVGYKPVAYATVPTPAELPPTAGTPQGTKLLALSTGMLYTNTSTGWVATYPPAPGSGGSGTGWSAGRNLLDNGIFRINQRSLTPTTNRALTTGNWFTSDRWQLLQNIAGFTVNALSGYPIASIAGSPSRTALIFSNPSIKAVAAGDYNVLRQAIEGNRLHELHWGTPAAEPLTLTFLMQTSRACNIAVQLVGQGNWRTNRLVSLVQGLNRFSVTFPGNPNLAIVPDNTTQLWCDTWFAAGSTYNDGNPAHIQTPGIWSNNTPAIQIASGVTNYWDAASMQVSFIEGQLEIGSQATPTEVLPYDQDLARCQRYSFYPGWNIPAANYVLIGPGFQTASGTAAVINVPLPVTMRAMPSLDMNGAAFSQYGAFERVGLMGTGNNITVESTIGTFSQLSLSFTYTAGVAGTGRAVQMLKISGQVANMGFSADI